MQKSTKLKDLTVDEFEKLVESKFNKLVEDLLEDIEATLSTSFRETIAQARQQVKEGKFITLEELEEKYELS